MPIHTHTRRLFPCILTVLVAGLAAPSLSASGFQLKEQSASAQGTSFAGISAGWTDISGMFFNPASLTAFQGNQALLGLSFVAPSAEFSGGAASRTSLIPAPLQPISGSTSHPNAGKSAVLPSLYAMWSVGSDLKLGLAVNAPYGLGTDYDPAWKGRYHAIHSSLKTLDIAPTAAYRVNDQWSVGASLVARRAQAELSSAVDFGTIGALAGVPGSVPGGADGLADLQGSGWGLGYRLGVRFQPVPTVRIGLAYQSGTSATLKGDGTFTGTPAALAGVFKNSGIKADMKLPSTASLGLAWDVTPDLTLLAEVARTGWACFDELRVRFDSGAKDSVTEERWTNSTYASVGATWKLTPTWVLRAGVALDKAPVLDDHRTPRIPDADRTWVSVGVGYQVSHALGFDLGVSRIQAKDSTLDLKAGGPTSPTFFAGNLSGAYKNSINVVAGQVRFSF